jgi:hypothetical protein
MSSRHALALLCIACVSACSDAAGPPPPSTAPTTLAFADPVDQLDVSGREPMIVEHPNGSLFVSGYGESTPTLWKSGDHGATWARVDVGPETSGAIGNSDVDLAVSRDGILYFVTMIFDRKVEEGRSVSIGVSKDAGATWSWTQLSKTRFDDRPWVEVAADGTAHVIWNDGNGVCHAISTDGGKTWTERKRIHTQGGSSHLAVGPNREVAVRITPLSASGNKFEDGVDLIAVSTDAGLTWQKHPAPGQREWKPMHDTSVTPPRWVEATQPRWVEPLAFDGEGALYSLWGNAEGLWLARSPDRGETWKQWRVVESRDTLHYPYLIAQGGGDVAATWFSGHADSLQAHVARFVVGADDRPPRMLESRPFQIDSWDTAESPNGQPIRDSAGEYLAVALLHDGQLAVVSPIQNRSAKRLGFTFRTAR